MVRTYQKKVGSRVYKNYSEEDLKKAVCEVKSGRLSQKAAAQKYKINRTTLLYKVRGSHEGNPGHPNVLSKAEEELIAQTLGTVSDWGFPMTKADIRAVIEKFVTKQGRVASQLENNVPGVDSVNAFAVRNTLSVRLATNIKKQRASVGTTELTEFYENIRNILVTTKPYHLYNYDETNITDDAGSLKVIVPRGRKRVERVREHSRTSISVMFCGTAAGNLLPPMVVYKSKNLYENWTKGGPVGSIYNHSESGWFDMNLFEQWFFKLLLPHVNANRQENETVVVLGDNLASHFSPEVVRASIENNIYFSAFPPNATHLLQPLDVGVFGPVKKKWRKVLDRWRQESRRRGTIPKEQFPMLLLRVWNSIAPNMESNLQGAFRGTGLYPFDPNVVLNKLPSEETNIGRILDASLLEFLRESRGFNENRMRHKRGKKLTTKPGSRISLENPMNQTQAEVLHQVTSSTAHPTTPLYSSDEDLTLINWVSKSSFKQAGERGEIGQDENFCSICLCDFRHYVGKDWVSCVNCKKWVCRHCNKGTTDPRYECPRCQDDEDM